MKEENRCLKPNNNKRQNERERERMYKLMKKTDD